jgi:hypothetical protein
MPSSGSRILIKLPLGDTLWNKFYKCLEIVSRLSFFMLGADLVQYWCRLGTRAWKQWTL